MYCIHLPVRYKRYIAPNTVRRELYSLHCPKHSSLGTIFQTQFNLKLKRSTQLNITMSTEVLVDGMTIAEMQATLEQAERKFRRACDQIVLLNERLSSCQIRYKKARDNNRKSLRYPLRLRLAMIEGIRNMYYDYATQKVEEIERLRNVDYIIDDIYMSDEEAAIN
ncbi:hypothetical protein MAR_001631 [Mya arenaria]|uniref:Uncharacterized protein n=1 Tax=Mya arenaria TaxID=6604 RepID=A0ABY7FGE8_MYAAR|nr:hypothetical protein MAR_001631 [Mya arenaria]